MPKENAEITSSRINARATIIVALIGIAGIIATAILNPLGQKWADRMESAPSSDSQAIEQSKKLHSTQIIRLLRAAM